MKENPENSTLHVAPVRTETAGAHRGRIWASLGTRSSDCAHTDKYSSYSAQTKPAVFTVVLS